MSTNVGKGTRAVRAGQLIAGARKRFPNGGQTLTLGGGATTVSVDAVCADLQKIIDNRVATTAAQATARDTVKAERAQTPALVQTMDEFEEVVRFMFGADSKALADFGLKPPKVRQPMTSAEKAAAAAKRKATREAHGTKTATAASAPAPAPAAAPGGAGVGQPKG
jgi:hypothetical protein